MEHGGGFRNGFFAGRVSHVAAVNPARDRKLWALLDRIRWPASSGSRV